MKCLSLIACSLLCATSAHAAIVNQSFSIEYTGGTQPQGAAPWISVTLDDSGGSGSVLLSVSGANLVSSEFLTKLMFNLDPALNPAQLTFATPTKIGTFADPVMSGSTNGHSAGGNALFDVLVEFDNAPPVNRFGSGDAMQVVISGIPTLTAHSFSFNSGGNTSLPIAAHVQGIGQNANQSGWITVLVPEPASLSAVTAVAAIARRRRA